MKEMSWRHIISKTFLPCQYLPFCSVQNVEDFSRKINYFLVILLCCFTPREIRHFVQVSKLFHTLQNASLPVVISLTFSLSLPLLVHAMQSTVINLHQFHLIIQFPS